MHYRARELAVASSIRSPLFSIKGELPNHFREIIPSYRYEQQLSLNLFGKSIGRGCPYFECLFPSLAYCKIVHLAKIITERKHLNLRAGSAIAV